MWKCGVREGEHGFVTGFKFFKEEKKMPKSFVSHDKNVDNVFLGFFCFF